MEGKKESVTTAATASIKYYARCDWSLTLASREYSTVRPELTKLDTVFVFSGQRFNAKIFLRSLRKNCRIVAVYLEILRACI